MALLAVVLATPASAENPNWTPPAPKKGFEYPPCYCTNREERVEIGGTACLRIGSREVWARCAMSVNNPIWRTLQQGCPPPEPSAGVAPPLPAG